MNFNGFCPSSSDFLQCQYSDETLEIPYPGTSLHPSSSRSVSISLGSHCSTEQAHTPETIPVVKPTHKASCLNYQLHPVILLCCKTECAAEKSLLGSFCLWLSQLLLHTGSCCISEQPLAGLFKYNWWPGISCKKLHIHAKQELQKTLLFTVRLCWGWWSQQQVTFSWVSGSSQYLKSKPKQTPSTNRTQQKPSKQRKNSWIF